MKAKLKKDKERFTICYEVENNNEIVLTPIPGYKNIDADKIIKITEVKSTDKCAYMVFDRLCKTIGIEFDVDEMRKNFINMFLDNGNGEIEVKVSKDVKMEDIEPNRLEEILMCIALAAKYEMQNPPWLWIIGGAGVGKTTTIYNTIGDKRLSHFVHRLTGNALMPGRHAEDSNVVSTFETANHRVIVIDDLGTLLGERDDTVRKFFGQFAGMYGRGESNVDDVTGTTTIKAHFCNVWGITWRNYRTYIKIMSDIGSRFVIYEYPTDLDMSYGEMSREEKDVVEYRKNLITSHILNTYERFKLSLPVVDDKKIELYSKRFFKKWAILRGVPWTNDITKMDHYQRMENVMHNLISLRSALNQREPIIEDFYFFESLFYPLISNRHIWTEYVYNQNLTDEKSFERNVIENAIDLGILKDELHFSKKWKDFVLKVCGIENLNSTNNII